MHMHAYLNLLPAIKDAPAGEVWMHYDAEADVLYINFTRPSVAADSELTDDDVIIRYDDQDRVIGYTILHAQKRSA
ncbi:MAG: DUF2283 domain-containing protein [Anaerolineae bacterium]|nr:DUF2283 domain-containing protein [Anaerolineae bacterium]